MTTISLTRITLATTKTKDMLAFYQAVLDADLKPTPAYGTTLYQGTLCGLPFLMCPNEVAGVSAHQSRHQFKFRVPDIAATVQRVLASGGMSNNDITEQNSVKSVVVYDPDGNSIELEQPNG